jgi:hypothetical protein
MDATLILIDSDDELLRARALVIRRALLELVKLGRYESRAAARRDKAVQQIIESRNVTDK